MIIRISTPARCQVVEVIVGHGVWGGAQDHAVALGAVVCLDRSNLPAVLALRVKRVAVFFCLDHLVNSPELRVTSITAGTDFHDVSLLWWFRARLLQRANDPIPCHVACLPFPREHSFRPDFISRFYGIYGSAQYGKTLRLVMGHPVAGRALWNQRCGRPGVPSLP